MSKVRMLKDWRTYREGSIIEPPEDIYNLLTYIGYAEPYQDKGKAKTTTKKRNTGRNTKPK